MSNPLTSFEECITIIDNKLYPKLQDIVDDYVTSRYRSKDLREGRITLEEDLKRRETDRSQKTQAVTKFLQYWIADAFAEIIEENDLPITDGKGSGSDYEYNGRYYRGEEISEPLPIEFKSSGGVDGSVSCLGNLGVNVKCDLTLVCRYTLTGNKVSHKQTVTVTDSAFKWKRHNPVKFDKDGNAKDSNFSDLKCWTVDYDTLVKYSGNLKKNDTWVKFIKEEINA